MIDTHRILPLEGIHNFRDYGSYPARGGARVKAGVLWRSGQHLDATAADLAEVARLDLKTVIDLRGDSERAVYPCARPEDFAAHVLFAPGDTAGLTAAAVHEEAGGGHDVTTATQAHAAMVRLYLGMAWRPVLAATYRLYFKALAERPGASLLHCLAGKDRTGLAAALAHHVLGVHPDDAMADYLLTNAAGNIERRFAAGADKIRGRLGAAMDDAAVRKLLSVHPEYLDTALAAIRERHGSIDAYLEDVIEVSPARAQAIRDALLA